MRETGELAHEVLVKLWKGEVVEKDVIAEAESDMAFFRQDYKDLEDTIREEREEREEEKSELEYERDEATEDYRNAREERDELEEERDELNEKLDALVSKVLAWQDAEQGSDEERAAHIAMVVYATELNGGK